MRIGKNKDESDGTPVLAANPNDVRSSKWYSKVTCTVTGTQASCPAITAPATESSPDNPTAKLGAYLFDTSGKPLGVFSVFGSFQVPASPTTTTWEDIRMHNIGTPPTIAVRDVTVTGSLTVGGSVTAPNFIGSAAGLHSFRAGASLINNSIVGNDSAGIDADHDGNGSGEAYLAIGGVTKFRAKSDGLSVESIVPFKLPGYATGSLPSPNVGWLAYDSTRAAPVWGKGASWRAVVGVDADGVATTSQFKVDGPVTGTPGRWWRRLYGVADARIGGW